MKKKTITVILIGVILSLGFALIFPFFLSPLPTAEVQCRIDILSNVRHIQVPAGEQNEERFIREKASSGIITALQMTSCKESRAQAKIEGVVIRESIFRVSIKYGSEPDKTYDVLYERVLEE